jgi:hypothetical protein
MEKQTAMVSIVTPGEPSQVMQVRPEVAKFAMAMEQSLVVESREGGKFWAGKPASVHMMNALENTTTLFHAMTELNDARTWNEPNVRLGQLEADAKSAAAELANQVLKVADMLGVLDK